MKNLKTIMSVLIQFIIYAVMNLVLIPVFLVLSLIEEDGFIFKAVCLSVVGAAVYGSIVNVTCRIIVGIIICLIAVISAAIAVYAANFNKDNDASQKKTYFNPVSTISKFFEGMSEDEAKKEYHKLLKKYHPDNAGGSDEKTAEIIKDYNDYRSHRIAK